MSSSTYDHSRRSIGIALGALGVVLGTLVTLGFLNGDELGRVNLLYLLILFAILPALSLLLSPLILLSNSRLSLASWLGEWNGWPHSWREALPTPPLPGAMRQRSFFLSQCLSLGLGGGSVFAFLLLLLINDLSFVWRSTLLDAQQLQPLLQLLASPWFFWAEAQPSLALLEASQEYRLRPDLEPARLGAWWRYALAAQITYNLLPRSLMLGFALYLQGRSKGQIQRVDSAGATPAIPRSNPDRPTHLADSCSHVAAPYYRIDWTSLPAPVSASVSALLGTPEKIISATPLSLGTDIARENSESGCVVVVKSWEPPMGELGDFLQELWPNSENLQEGQRLIMPLDWTATEIKTASEQHIDEWRRFAAAIPAARILYPGGSSQ